MHKRDVKANALSYRFYEAERTLEGIGATAPQPF